MRHKMLGFLKDMDINMDLSHIEESIGYVFKDKSLLEMALTHSSYANERKINKICCNERLEFLGDAVLELVSSDYLYHRFTELPEGKLSKMRAYMVCEPSLYECSKDIDLGNNVKLGKGEYSCGGSQKPSVVSDAFEALIGAVYLDGGLVEASAIIHRFILTEAQTSAANECDSKSKLQELVQAKKAGLVISYRTLSEEGPEHNKSFKVAVYINDVEYGLGEGHSKKNAEKAAAKNAIVRFEAENK